MNLPRAKPTTEEPLSHYGLFSLHGASFFVEPAAAGQTLPPAGLHEHPTVPFSWKPAAGSPGHHHSAATSGAQQAAGHT